MSIIVRWAFRTATGVFLFATSMPALAQADPNVMLNTLRECSKIEDPPARFACYDHNIRDTDATIANPVPSQSEGTQPDSAPIVSAGAPGSARESTRSLPPPAAPAGEPGRRALTVAAVAEKAPGAYVVTLDDGEQWEFAEDLGFSYRPPHRGATVEIERGAMGSHRLRFDRQQPVRVRRVL